MTVVILLILLGTAGLLLAAQHAEITSLTRTVNYLHAHTIITEALERDTP